MKKELQNIYIPLCYYPTTLGFLDDNKAYLNKLLIMFGDEFPCIAFDDPEKSIKSINNSLLEGSFLDRCKVPIDKTSDYITYKIDLKQLRREVFRKNRFSEISVFLIDFSMPPMNGLDFCRKFTRKDIMFFLLTGEADENVALNAYGEGIIQGFCKKSSPNLQAILSKSIVELQKRRFIDITSKLLNQTEASLFDFLRNEAVYNVFNSLCEKNKIVEFYLVRDRGDFILFNEKAEISFLSIKSKKEIQNFYEQADMDEASSEILTSLKKMEKIPVFFDSEELTPWADEWDKYLFPAQKVPGDENYYYSYVENINREDLKNILSYRDYLFNH